LQAFVLGIDVSRIKVVKIVAGSVILDYLSKHQLNCLMDASYEGGWQATQRNPVPSAFA
jgi:hypothetical protein